MTWEHPLLRRQTLQYRPISLIVLVVTCVIVGFSVAHWLHLPSVKTPSQAETEAIQAALSQYSSMYGKSPIPTRTIKTVRLHGLEWIVQIHEDIVPEIGKTFTSTFHVSHDHKCQLINTSST